MDRWYFKKKTAGMGPGSRIFLNVCDFCFSWILDHALSIFENFDCQGNNSLNFGPIFTILVPKHISFPRPFLFIYCTSTWHVLTWPETCPKVGPWKTKSQKLKKILLPGPIPAVFLKPRWSSEVPVKKSRNFFSHFHELHDNWRTSQQICEWPGQGGWLLSKTTYRAVSEDSVLV